jgi:hypothetical protein
MSFHFSLLIKRLIVKTFSLVRQSICCVQCRLSGVTNGSLANVTTLSSCHQLLSLHFSIKKSFIF